MASKALMNPFLRCFVTRGYAQAAPAFQKESVLQSHVLPNKLTVTVLETNAPVARVTLAFRAGSRYEPVVELGLSHVLRTAAGLSTKTASSFIMARKLQQLGASVTSSGDREFIYYTLETSQDNLEAALDIFSNLVCNQEFRPWELNDNMPKIKYEVAALPPQVRAVDLMHKAAFRRNLGNSLFISPKRIESISSESLQHFSTSHLTTKRGVVTTVGISEDKAISFAQELQLLTSGEEKQETSVYYGGDIRKDTGGGDLAHIALAVKGAAANTPQAIALAIGAKALGSGPSVKWGADNSPIAKAIGNIGPFAAAGFNVSYSDNGLFGIVLSVPRDEACNATKAIGNLLKNPKLSNDAITAGKNLLKLQLLSEAEEATSLAESLAAQTAYSGTAKLPIELAKQIDQISFNDVTSTLQAAGNSTISMGAVGDLSFVPYVDEL